jgi:hypothetical protein
MTGMWRIVSAMGLTAACSAAVAATAQLGWPEVVSRLTQERSQVEACVGLIKSTNDKPTIDKIRATYEIGRGEMDGVIAGLKTALVEGGKPEALATVQASLESSGAGVKGICDEATRNVAPNTKGVWEEIAKGAVEPLITAISAGVGALWSHQVDKDKLELETKKAQLEAARWPKFGDIAAR